MIQYMAKSKTSGNIGRRHKDCIGSFSVVQHSGTFGMKTPYGFPVRTSPSVFNFMMVIGFFQIE